MKKFTALKKNITKIAVMLTVLCMTLVCFLGIGLNRAVAEENNNDYSFNDYANTELKVSNNQFNNFGSGYPYSPNSWTGAYLGNYANTSLVGGVITLTSEDYLNEDNYEEVKLYKYKEYENKEIPKTPFGINTSIPNGDLYYPNTNKNVLMINTNGATVSYAYTSNDISLDANAFYKFSVFVKTGDFTQSQGAVIKLTNFTDEKDVGFWNINTLTSLKDADGNYELTKDNLYGWKEYSIYVATGNTEESVKLSLQVGDFSEDYVTPSNGYAFFDNINAYKISATTFYQETARFSNHTKDYNTVKDNNDYNYLQSNGNVIGDFSNGLTGWTDITVDKDGNHFGGANKYIYNAMNNLAPDNAIEFVADPVAPKGKIADNNVSTNNIFVLKSKNKVQAGVISDDIFIQRNKYYRIGVWTNAQDLGVGSQASVVISGQSSIAANDYILEKVADDSIAVNDGIEARYGWKELSFYVRGSSLRDVNINIELWLGYTTPSSGIVMFDEITFTEINYTEYKDYNTTGTLVNVDAEVPSTGVANGLFSTAGDNDEYKYPLKPADWTMHDGASVATTGYSNNPVNTDNLAMGIIATDAEHFNANRQNYLDASNPVNTGDTDISNVLLIASKNQTAVCYSSGNMRITTNTNYKLEITLQVRNIQGYGASIVLKNGNNVATTIEGIKSTNNTFKTFTIYIEGDSVANTTNVEIWLGLNDKNLNRSKLSSGYVYVSKVAITSIGDKEEFANNINLIKEEYKAGNLTDKSYYSFVNTKFDNFDHYSTSQIKEGYNWTLEKADINSQVTTGYFDASNMPVDQTEIPSYFTKAFENLNTTNNTVLYLRNSNATYSSISLYKSMTFTATKYYLATFNVMVDIPAQYLENENSVGATISFGGLSRKFEIKNTFDTAGIETENGVVYNKMFKTYKFYIAAGDADVTSNLNISLGGKLPNQYVAGRIYIADASIQEITNIEFEEATEGVEEDDEFIRFVNYTENTTTDDDLTEDDDTSTDTGDTTEQVTITSAWWFIPSILFAIAIVGAIVGVVIRRVIEKRANRKIKAQANSYDRKNTILFDENGETPVAYVPETIAAKSSDTIYDNFDEDANTNNNQKVRLVATSENLKQEEEQEPEFHDEFED